MDLRERIAATTDPRVPPDERYDLNVEHLREFRRGLDLLHPEEFQDLGRDIALGKSLAEQQFGGLDVTRRTVPIQDGNGRVSVLHVSELGVLSPYPGTRWTEKPDPIGFQALAYMADTVPLLNSIINTRVRQVNTFARRYKDRGEYPVGYQISRGDGDRLSEEDKKNIDVIESWLVNCGDEPDAVTRHWVRRRDNLHTFLGKIVRATLTADACPIETEPTAGGKRLSGMYAIPFDTVRLCSEDGYEGNDQIVGLQLWEMRVTTLYEAQRLIYEVRHPRPNMLVGGYGYSEPEMAIRVATAFLNTFAYNDAAFNRNQIPRGILQLHGNYQQDQLEFFKRQWNAMLTGPAQRWRLPVLVSKHRESGAIYTPVDQTNNEMHYAKWLSFLVSMLCGLYGMSPEEVNLDSFNTKTSSLSGNDTAERLASSKDKGLEPLLQFLERILNEWIVSRLGFGDNQYVIQFRGLHPITPELQWTQDVALKSRNEARAERGMDDYPDPEVGDLPLDPAVAAIVNQNKVMEQMQAQGMGGMDGGMGGGEEEQQLPDYIRQRFGGGNGNGNGEGNGRGNDKGNGPGGPPRNGKDREASAKGKLQEAAQATKALRPRVLLVREDIE